MYSMSMDETSKFIQPVTLARFPFSTLSQSGIDACLNFYEANSAAIVVALQKENAVAMKMHPVVQRALLALQIACRSRNEDEAIWNAQSLAPHLKQQRAAKKDAERTLMSALLALADSFFIGTTAAKAANPKNLPTCTQLHSESWRATGEKHARTRGVCYLQAACRCVGQR